LYVGHEKRKLQKMSLKEHKNLPRLYIAEEGLLSGKNCLLSDTQGHYLRNVMRLKAGDALRVFNGADGEWLSSIKEINKKNVIIALDKKLLEQKAVLASPVKKEPFELMIEKASELGAARFLPVICAHTVVHRMNGERAKLIAIEAAEQCERLDVMQIGEPAELKNLIKTWDKNRKLVFCVEREGGQPVASALQNLPVSAPLAILIGPEGGFTDDEIAHVCAQDFTIPVSLGPRILRAETAMIAALACVQALRC
jgi:16S rRNA (uracil1498-N3)-methyltransferase